MSNATCNVDSENSRNQKDESFEFNNSAGVPCEICGGLYGTASIGIHQKECSKKKERELANLAAQQKHEEGQKSFRPMPGVICYICGRRFGKASIDIHEKQCLEKWHVQNSQLPPNERKKPPVKPEISKESLVIRAKEEQCKGNGKYNLDDAYNDAMMEAHAQNMAQCNKCGRRFNSDRLEVHAKACKGK